MSANAIIRRSVALLAAYLIALQAVLSVLEIFTHVAAATAASDFVICSGSGPPPSDNDGLPTSHNHICLALCAGLGNGAGCLVDQPVLKSPSYDLGQSICFPINILTTARAFGASAHRSRAPPLG